MMSDAKDMTHSHRNLYRSNMYAKNVPNIQENMFTKYCSIGEDIKASRSLFVLRFKARKRLPSTFLFTISGSVITLCAWPSQMYLHPNSGNTSGLWISSWSSFGRRMNCPGMILCSVAFIINFMILSVQTSGNNLTQLEKKFGSSKEADWDSGFSDG